MGRGYVIMRKAAHGAAGKAKRNAERGWKMRERRCIMPSSRGGKMALAAAAGCLLLIAAILLLRHGAAPETPAPSQRLQTAAAGRNDYQLTLRLNPEDSALSITQTLTYRNDTGDALDTLLLRTWLNAYQTEETSPAATEELYDSCYPDGFSPGWLELFDVRWQGEIVTTAYLDAAQTALSVPIPALKPGECGELTLRAVAHIPVCAHRTGYADGVWMLGNVIPLLSRYEDGAWRQDEYSAVGDPFLSDCANFRVQLFVPEGYVPACTAALSQAQTGVWTGEAMAARDLGLCVSAAYKTASAMQGNTLVTAYALDAAGARRGLQAACRTLETFSALYGEYPYPSYQICQVDFPFGGMEYPAMSLIAGRYFDKDMQDSLELVMAHETAHQWFYALVGSDQVNQPWQDEALSEYAMLRYVKARYGQGSYESLKYFRVDAPMRESVAGSLTPGSPISYFGNLTDYATVVYGRGAALLLALDTLLPGGVDGFLRQYAETFAFSYASRTDFESCLHAYAGMDLSPLLLDYLDTLM